ncbi:MAG: hypothetical protein ACSHX4_08365 [Opitutaceae bacterium]
MKVIKFTLLTIFLSVSVVFSAGRSARVIYFGAAADAPKKAFVYQIGAEAQEVILGRHNFSETFKLSPEAKHLAFLPGVLPVDTPVPANAPLVNIPEGWNQVLILVFKDKSNPIMPIRLFAVNANDDAFGPGEIYFVNLSQMTVFGLVGDKKLISKPRTSEVISDPRTGRGKYMLKLDAYKDDVKKRRRLVQQKCLYDPSVRIVTFMVPLPPPRMVKVYSAPVRDF